MGQRIYLLLPYLKKKPLDIVSLNDIYIKKEKNVDINKTEPKYIYSNIQYDKCIESNGKYFEYEFTEDDFNQNLKLLINTLKLCSNKLHFNFINIYPFFPVLVINPRISKDNFWAKHKNCCIYEY